MGPLLPFVKLGVSAVAGIPVAKIVNDIVKNNVTVVTKVDKAKVVTGSFIIGTMVAGSLQKTTDALVDAIVALKHRTEETEENTDEESTEES